MQKEKSRSKGIWWLLIFISMNEVWAKAYICCMKSPDSVELVQALSSEEILKKCRNILPNKNQSIFISADNFEQAIAECTEKNYLFVLKNISFLNQTSNEQIFPTQFNQFVQQLVQQLSTVNSSFGVTPAPVCFDELSVPYLPPNPSPKIRLQNLMYYQLLSLQLNESQYNSFIAKLTDKIVEMGQELVNDTERFYDVIIIGGGVVGTALALELGRTWKTLVIDAQKRPSPFGQSGEFYLNSKDISEYNLSVIDKFLLPKDHAQKVPAKRMGDYILLNLFLSGAELILGKKVTGYGYSGKEDYPYKVIVENDQAFFGKVVIQALGIGKPQTLKGKDGKELAATSLITPQGPIQLEKDFLSQLHNNYQETMEQLKGKTIAVVGNRDGGYVVVNGALGMGPQSFQAQASTDDIKEPVIGPELPQIYWFGKNYFRSDFETPGLVKATNQSKLFKEQQRVTDIQVTSDQRFSLTVESDSAGTHQHAMVFDRVILATGYTPHLSLWSDEKEDVGTSAGSFIMPHPPFASLASTVVKGQHLAKEVDEYLNTHGKKVIETTETVEVKEDSEGSASGISSGAGTGTSLPISGVDKTFDKREKILKAIIDE